MENDREDRVKTTDLHKQMPAQNPPDLLATYYQQCYPVGDYRSTTRQRTD